MNKVMKNFGYMVLGAVTVLALFGAVSSATSGEPGTSTDPLVTKSYVEKRLAEINTTLNDKLTSLTARVSKLEAGTGTGGSTGSTVPGAPPAFVVVELKAGDTVTFGENTQVILRGGSATAIAGVNDLPDVTGGNGLSMGQKIPLNHLIIIPKNDGRGMSIKERTWLMISGQYTVTPAVQ